MTVKWYRLRFGTRIGIAYLTEFRVARIARLKSSDRISMACLIDLRGA